MSSSKPAAKPQRKLAWRLVVYILVYSSIITLILTGLQLYRDYKVEVHGINQLLGQIEISGVPSISNDLWVINRTAIEVQIEALRSLPDIQYIAIIDENGVLVEQSGVMADDDVIARDFPLYHQHRGRELKIGILKVVATLEGVYQRLLDKVVVILISQAAKTFLVSAFIFILFQNLVTRHLSSIADYVSNIDMRGGEPPLELVRKESARTRNDEFEQVVNAINAMQVDLKKSYQSLSRHRDELERTVESRTRELELKNRELTSFCYSVSHDLRTPLRGINGFSHILVEDYGDQLDEQARGYLDRVCHAAEHMGKLMDDLLRLFRVSQCELQYEDFDLTDLSEGVIQRLRGREPERKVNCKVQPGMRLNGDHGTLQLAMENLIENAWKYTGHTPEPDIVVGQKRIDGESVVYVQDNGAGFDVSYSDKLFQPFERLHSSIDFEGTGIGLATVYRVIERHGGRIWAESELGEGATFYFVIPESPDELVS